MSDKPQSWQQKVEGRGDLNRIDISVLQGVPDSDLSDNLSWGTGESLDTSLNGSSNGNLSDEEDNVVSCIDELSNSSGESSVQGLLNESVESQPETSSDAFDAEDTQSLWSNTTITSMDTNTSDMSDEPGTPSYDIYNNI